MTDFVKSVLLALSLDIHEIMRSAPTQVTNARGDDGINVGKEFLVECLERTTIDFERHDLGDTVTETGRDTPQVLSRHKDRDGARLFMFLTLGF